MPSTPQNKGITITATAWHKQVLNMEINKDNKPLDNAVKNDEPKMFNPANRKQIE